MKILPFCVLGLSFATCAVCLAQPDIYQSDAYSVEEMCAREADQATTTDYTDAYETCVEKNRNKSMYQSDQNDVDVQLSDESHTEDDTEL